MSKGDGCACVGRSVVVWLVDEGEEIGERRRDGWLIETRRHECFFCFLFCVASGAQELSRGHESCETDGLHQCIRGRVPSARLDGARCEGVGRICET